MLLPTALSEYYDEWKTNASPVYSMLRIDFISVIQTLPSVGKKVVFVIVSHFAAKLNGKIMKQMIGQHSQLFTPDISRKEREILLISLLIHYIRRIHHTMSTQVLIHQIFQVYLDTTSTLQHGLRANTTKGVWSHNAELQLQCKITVTFYQEEFSEYVSK